MVVEGGRATIQASRDAVTSAQRLRAIRRLSARMIPPFPRLLLLTLRHMGNSYNGFHMQLISYIAARLLPRLSGTN